MKTLKFKGASVVRRTITKEQFEERGVTDQDTIVLEVSPMDRTIELSDSAAELLLTAEPKEWEVVEVQEPEAAPKVGSKAKDEALKDEPKP